MNLTSMKVELFIDDLAASIDFYGRVLGFTMGEQQSDGYTPMHNGPVTIALNLRTTLPDDHPIHYAGDQQPGLGVEFVLWLEDLKGSYARVKEQGWPISGELQRQPWGLEDFRLKDPDGYYLRFTSRL